MTRPTTFCFAVILAALLVSCAPEEVAEAFEPSASHSAYADGLAAMGLADTAMGRAWLAAADAALTSPERVALPFESELVFSPAAAGARGLLFTARHGQELRITLEIEGGADGKIFADLFRWTEGGNEPFPQVASYSEALNRLDFKPNFDGAYLLRLQPELLHGGTYRLRIQSLPSLAFPVEGHSIRNILSFFGADRDAGARRHEGVDIFAPRGTRVLAAAPGLVRSAGERGGLGGKTVSIVDEETGNMHYYAHLDDWLVQAGQRVVRGQAIGLVGNTGNAATTPPHLHFGVYRMGWRGAVDPWYFLANQTVPLAFPD